MSGTVPKWGTRTSYEGTVMRSRLEAGFAAHLDLECDRRQQQGHTLLTWHYEPQAFADRHGQYTPDFLIELDGQQAYVEVKPTHAQALGAHSRMHVITASAPAAELWTANPVGLTRDDYRPERCTWRLDRVHRHVPADLTASLTRGDLTWQRTGDLLVTTGIAIIDAVTTGGPWTYQVGQKVDTPWARHTAEYKTAHPGTWVLAAAHGADGPNVPLIELDQDAVITDLYPAGHHFTCNELDRLRQILAMERGTR